MQEAYDTHLVLHQNLPGVTRIPNRHRSFSQRETATALQEGMTAYTEALLNDEDNVEGRAMEDALYEAGRQNGAWPESGKPLVNHMNHTIVRGVFSDKNMTR